MKIQRYSFSGYIIWNNKLFWGNEFIPIFSEHLKKGRFEDFLRKYNGVFYIIIATKNTCNVLIDRYGFLPLMYRKERDEIIISNNSDNLIKDNDKWNDNAMIEYFSCGFCIGENTLIQKTHEFLPHRIYTLSNINNKIEISEKSYWQLKLALNTINKKDATLRFQKLIKRNFDIYTDYISKNGNKIIMPISGGLDSRMLMNEFDKRDVSSYLITFGGTKDNYDLKRGLELGFLAKNVLGHFIHVNTPHLLYEALNMDVHSNKITTAHKTELYYYSYNKFLSKTPFFISGQSGGFLTGSHMRIKMKNWKTREDAIKYIFKFKTSPFIKNLTPEHQNYLLSRIDDSIPKDIDPINAVYLWEIENRQRKYMARYCMLEDNEETLKILMPYYDNDLIDFFSKLEFTELLNQRFFIRSIKSFLYANNREFLKVKRVDKKIRNVHNHYITEYFPKIKNLLMSRFHINSKKSKFISDTIDWQNFSNSSYTPPILQPYLRYKLGDRQNEALFQIRKIINDNHIIGK